MLVVRTIGRWISLILIPKVVVAKKMMVGVVVIMVAKVFGVNKNVATIVRWSLVTEKVTGAFIVIVLKFKYRSHNQLDQYSQTSK